MICEIINSSPDLLSAGFPGSINLEEVIDPFTQSPLAELIKRASKQNMPYYAFAIASLENSRYAVYDAIHYRMSINPANNIKNCDKDPYTRLKICNVRYFALPILQTDHPQTIQAYSYPSQSYIDLANQNILEANKIERYAFSALNYTVLEGSSMQDQRNLKNIQQVLTRAFDCAVLATSDCRKKSAYQLEGKKWEKLTS